MPEFPRYPDQQNLEAALRENGFPVAWVESTLGSDDLRVRRSGYWTETAGAGGRVEVLYLFEGHGRDAPCEALRRERAEALRRAAEFFGQAYRVTATKDGRVTVAKGTPSAAVAAGRARAASAAAQRTALEADARKLMAARAELAPDPAWEYEHEPRTGGLFVSAVAADGRRFAHVVSRDGHGPYLYDRGEAWRWQPDARRPGGSLYRDDGRKRNGAPPAPPWALDLGEYFEAYRGEAEAALGVAPGWVVSYRYDRPGPAGPHVGKRSYAARPDVRVGDSLHGEPFGAATVTSVGKARKASPRAAWPEDWDRTVMALHRAHVESALAAGLPVPEHVLAGYPGVAARKPNAAARRVPKRVAEAMRDLRLDEAAARSLLAEIDGMNRHPGPTADGAVRAVSAFNTAVGGFGVLAVDGRRFGARGGLTRLAAYVNTGDLYNPTVLYDLVDGRVRLTTLADFIERRSKTYELRWDVAP